MSRKVSEKCRRKTGERRKAAGFRKDEPFYFFFFFSKKKKYGRVGKKLPLKK